MMLKSNLPSIHDKESAAVPADLPVVIDAHVHIFPRKIFSAIRECLMKTPGISDIR